MDLDGRSYAYLLTSCRPSFVAPFAACDMQSYPRQLLGSDHTSLHSSKPTLSKTYLHTTPASAYPTQHQIPAHLLSVPFPSLNFNSSIPEAPYRSLIKYRTAYKWAHTILTSRSFSTSMLNLPGNPSFPILYPVLDLLNHHPRSKVEWFFGETRPDLAAIRRGEVRRPPTMSFQLKNLQDIKNADAVCNNYGPKSNAELLLGYGFVLENNPVEQVLLKARTLSHASEDTHVKQRPFGMDPKAIKYSNAGLRKKENLLGRYQCDVPFFRGVPNFIVQLSYELCLSRRNKFFGDDLAPTARNPVLEHGRCVLGTLVSLYGSILSQCERLEEMPFAGIGEWAYNVRLDENQRNAWLYREGQRHICHCIWKELKWVLTRLSKPECRKDGLPLEPCIATITTALRVFKIESPEAADVFIRTVSKYLHRDVDNPYDTAPSNSEKRIWVFLLIVFSRVRK